MIIMNEGKYGISAAMVKRVEQYAAMHLGEAAPEHGIEHARSVREIALQILDVEADRNMCAVIALLHDTDDYKQFPDSRGGVPNALNIMRGAGIPEQARNMIERDLKRFGYSKRLKGLVPETPEAKTANDADMLDIMGASGIIRLAYYDANVGEKFFDPDEMPNPDVNFESYTSCTRESAVRHMFDKILRLPRYMLTEKGRIEALARRETCVRFLSDLFREQRRPDWKARLDDFMIEELAIEKEDNAHAAT